MRSKLMVALAALALVSCQKAPVETRIQTVHCVTPDQFRRLVEAMPEKVGDELTGDAQKDFKLTAESAVLLRVYANGLLTVLGGCTAPEPQASFLDTAPAGAKT
jgi:hypothetical protein